MSKPFRCMRHSYYMFEVPIMAALTADVIKMLRKRGLLNQETQRIAGDVAEKIYNKEYRRKVIAQMNAASAVAESEGKE